MRLNNIIESEDLLSLDIYPTKDLEPMVRDIVEHIRKTRSFSAEEIGRSLSIEHAKFYMYMQDGRSIEKMKEDLDRHLVKLKNLEHNPDGIKFTQGLFDIVRETDKRIQWADDRLVIDGEHHIFEDEINTYPKLKSKIDEIENCKWCSYELAQRIIFHAEKYFIRKEGEENVWNKKINQ